MTAVHNPALEAFVKHLRDEFTFAQVLIRRQEPGFELRHVTDRGVPVGNLKLYTTPALRELAQLSTAGEFRPLKSSPNLRSGWRALAANPDDLDAAVNRIYPGGIADWHAARAQSGAPVTNYREFTGRQTGMYRITAMLSDTQAAEVIRAGCHRRFCLKQRLWTVSGLDSDKAEEKSALPCLEPCPVLLEFARKGMRIEQEEQGEVRLPASDLESVIESIHNVLETPTPHLREADFESPENPRRQQLALEKLKARFAKAKGQDPISPSGA